MKMKLLPLLFILASAAGYYACNSLLTYKPGLLGTENIRNNL